jgi:hypothetical protein
LLTGYAQRLVNQSGKGFGVCGALATRLIGLVGHLRYGLGRVRPPDMKKEADQHKSDHEELVKQQVWRHDEVLFHGDTRKPLYRIHPLPNYPLDAGTAPGAEEGKQLIELDLTHPHVVQRSSCLTNQSHDGE